MFGSPKNGVTNLKRNPFKCLRKIVKKEIDRPRVDRQETVYDDSYIDYLVLKDIECVDADGNVFEKYEELHVAKNVERSEAGNHISFTPYKAIAHFEEKGWFLPSMALSCNILVKLFDKAVRKRADGSYETLDPEAKAVLDTYKDYGLSWGWHAQNTLIDYGSSRIIHYPSNSDFTSRGGNRGINGNRTRRILEFSKDGLQESKLEGILNRSNPGLTRFLKQFTGLRDLEKLVEIGDYFGKPAKLWFPWSGNGGREFNETRSGWLGWDGSCNFDLDGGYLYYDNCASGVREP